VCEREKEEMILMKEKKEFPTCPKCGSKDTRARLKTKELWCRRCGFVGKRKDFFKEKSISYEHQG